MVKRTNQKLTICLLVGIGLMLVSNTAIALEFIPGIQFYNEDWTTIIKTDTESSLNKVSDVIAINGTGDSIIAGAYYENSTMVFYLARTNATGGFKWFQNLEAENISVVRQIANAILIKLPHPAKVLTFMMYCNHVFAFQLTV